MVKKSASRFQSAKAPAGSKKPASERKRHAKPSTTAKRRNKFYSEGKGSTGVLVSRPRLTRVIRNARKAQTERYRELTGIEPKGKRAVLKRGFVDVSVGAMDAYANRIMEIAAEFAKGRRGKSMTLRTEDIVRATQCIRRIAHP